MQGFEAAVIHKIIGERNVTEREFFVGEAKFTATWDARPCSVGDISVHVQVRSFDENEMIEIVLDQNNAEKLLETLLRYKSNGWKI